MSLPNSQTRVGFVGSGFIAKGIAFECQRQGYTEGPILTRRNRDSIEAWPTDHPFTDSVDALIEGSDLIVECSGDVIHATRVIEQVLAAGRPVVTMNAEFHVTTGSHFVGKGQLTEAEGDQPGCLAALRREVVAMGFEPLVYGNVKGFLNLTPEPEEMKKWSKINGISLENTTSFTDGTKMQIEQAFVANAFGAGILQQGLRGAKSDDGIEGMLEKLDSASKKLAAAAEAHGGPISDYAQIGGCPAVFIAARHDEFHHPYLNYMKLGEGPYFNLVKNYHLCHIEVLKTIREVLDRPGSVLLDNSAAPAISVAAIAKRPIAKGTEISKAVGSFDLRGEAIEIATAPDHAPIGLLQAVRFKEAVEPDQIIQLDQVEGLDEASESIWRSIVSKVPSPQV